MIDNMFSSHHQQQKQSMPQHDHQLSTSGFGTTPSFDQMSSADVMQFADFCPEVALKQTWNHDDQETGIDPVYFSKFPVFNEKIEYHNQTQHIMFSEIGGNISNGFLEEKDVQDVNNDNFAVELRFTGGGGGEKNRENKNVATKEVKINTRKRARTIKTREEVESQRMTHIVVERNRRKQMNEHLRVIRSLLPGSYVKRV